MGGFFIAPAFETEFARVDCMFEEVGCVAPFALAQRGHGHLHDLDLLDGDLALGAVAFAPARLKVLTQIRRNPLHALSLFFAAKLLECDDTALEAFHDLMAVGPALAALCVLDSFDQVSLEFGGLFAKHLGFFSSARGCEILCFVNHVRDALANLVDLAFDLGEARPREEENQRQGEECAFVHGFFSFE